jgi:holliday junction DNA helicase RuvA
MIAALKGRLLEKHPSRLIVDVGGVGYEVHVPLSTFFDLAAPGADVNLRIHTHVREDQLALFGFGSALELQIFERLLSVSGIGPRVALGVLSGIEPTELIHAVQRADVARLTRIPGVGKKTAERLIVELKDRLPAATAPEQSEGTPSEQGSGLRGDLVSALANLGYQLHAAEKAVDQVLKGARARQGNDDVQFEHALREALRELAR